MRHTSVIAVFATAVTLAACTENELYVPAQGDEIVLDNRVEIDGSFCAESADDLTSFLKIMIIMDRSNSLRVTDPSNQRLVAAQNLVQRYLANDTTLELRAGVEFALISFYGDVNVHTRDERGLPGFTDNGRQVVFSLPQLARQGSNTNYQGALANAFLLLDRDMAQLEDSARSRTRYEIIFLSDGTPFPDNCRGEANAPSAAVRAVDRIVSIGTLYNVDVHLSTVFAARPEMFSAPNGAGSCTQEDPYFVSFTTIGESTRALMRDMASHGRGTFSQFLSGDAISFANFDFAESRRIYALSNFMISNMSARPIDDVLHADSDRDGLTDEDELLIGSSPILADSDGDGFNDMVEWTYRLSGFDPMDPTDARCTGITAVDGDYDGLLDCEEIFLGTQRASFDSDNDSIPDTLEVYFDGNPRSANATQDRFADDDADGGGNADELRWHTDPKVDDVAYRAKFAYRYAQEQLPLTGEAACYDFDVKNIRMASTRALPAGISGSTLKDPTGVNRIMLYFAQTPYDDPAADPVYRLACVEGRYVTERDLKVPASGEFRLPTRRPSNTFEPSGVLRPNNDVCQASVNQDCGTDTLWCRFEITGACTCCRARQGGTDPNDGTDCGPCPACSDGQDNDGDGKTDFPFDPNCFDSLDSDEGDNTACSNGVDDDGDGLIDFPNDPGCSSGYDTSELDAPTQPRCFNFDASGVPIDDDGDGASNYPNDPDCDSAFDDDEGVFDPTGNSAPVGPPACDDGQDNDGDGRCDFAGRPGCPADPGCGSADDPDESGPQTCFFCERYTDAQPGQCDIGAGLCKPRSGQVPQAIACASNADCGDPTIGEAPCVNGTCVPTSVNAERLLTSCTSRADCRGAPCLDTAGNQCFGAPCAGGRCTPCLSDQSCDTAPGARDGLCDERVGWCLNATTASTPVACVADGDCTAGLCQTDIGYCAFDPYYACSDNRDCREDEECSRERGYCLRPSFITEQCETSTECTTDLDADGTADGVCSSTLHWCLPTAERFQCKHDDECPAGNCVKDAGADFGYCDQPTFVFPENFDPEVDCIRGR
jgi:hypothetical protein